MEPTPNTHIREPRAHGQERVNAQPQDPATNTRPRGNGVTDRAETEKSLHKLEDVLGH
jgi:hypothetical protein